MKGSVGVCRQCFLKATETHFLKIVDEAKKTIRVKDRQQDRAEDVMVKSIYEFTATLLEDAVEAVENMKQHIRSWNLLAL